jgi:potassium channel subfamily K
LIGDIAALHQYSPPTGSNEIYSEGFWNGFAAAVLYLILTILLTINLVGYIRGHYPQHFELTRDQQTLIVQTMLYFIWLAGGAGVFARIEGWRFVDGLYWSNVTILTIGFGDLYPQTDLGRGLLIPYSISGIIMLGLVITSIFRSVEEMGQKNIIRLHYEKERERVMGRTVTTSLELERREIELELARERAHHRHHHGWHHQHPHHSSSQHSSSHLTLQRSITSDEDLEKGQSNFPAGGSTSLSGSLSGITMASKRSSISSILDRPSLTRQSSRLSVSGISKKKAHLKLLRKEKERFDAMRRIQKRSEVWKNWWRLSITLTYFTVFWYLLNIPTIGVRSTDVYRVVGAVIFWQAETNYTGQSLWISVYFCWVSGGINCLNVPHTNVSSDFTGDNRLW